MHDTKPCLTRPRSLLQRQVAMHRWEAEGGALAQRATQQALRRDLASLAPGEAVARLTQLHIRVIALENMVISLLAQASDRQLDIAREMAIFISPRCGATPHGLTIGAAVEMNSLVDRASRFRT